MRSSATFRAQDKLGDCSGLRLSNAASVRVLSPIYLPAALSAAPHIYIFNSGFIFAHRSSGILMHYYTLKYNFECAINRRRRASGNCRGAEDKKRRIAVPPAGITKQIDQDWIRPSCPVAVL